MTWKFRKDNECFEYNGDFVPNQYVANSLNAYLQEFGRLEKEVVELKARVEELECLHSNLIQFLKQIKKQIFNTVDKPVFSRASLVSWFNTYIKKLEGGE